MLGHTLVEAEVGGDCIDDFRICTQVGTHRTHYITADNHCSGSSDGVRGIPYRHLGGKFRRMYPARKQACARRIAYALKQLVEHNGGTHQEHKHVDKVRTLVDTGDP